jgi:uncharacterized protein (DUF433 family)
MLKRWLYDEDPVMTPRFESRIVTFRDLIQVVAVRTLRRSEKGAKLTLQYIRDTVRSAEREHRIKYPLAREHTMYVYANRLILKVGDHDYVGLQPGVDKDQLYHHRIIEPFLTEVRFDTEGVADQWTPLRSKNFWVSLDANRRFGMPIIEPLGMLVWPVADAVTSEGSIQAAADVFNVDVEAVELALKYRYDYLSPAA